MGKPEDFYRRFKQVCDDSQIVPEYGHGRQVYIAQKLKVTQEAVRKWFSGDSRPRTAKMRELAKLLEVDEAWLSLGVEPEMDRSEKRLHTQKSDGAVYLLYGAMMMEGIHCAFPGEKDPRRGYVDLYGIYKGLQYAVHVSAAREVSKNVFEFILPRETSDVRCVGVVKVGNFSFHAVNFPPDKLEQHKERKGGQFRILVSRKDGEYSTGADVWPLARTAEDFQ